MSQSDSIDLVKANKKKILSKLTTSQDRCVEKAESSGAYTLKGFAFTYSHSRPLPKKTAEKAMLYIRAIVAKYPFQLRKAMARPLWDRFAEMWCETGDESKSLRAI